MNEKDLKKVIKQMVRESLTEIFAEMKLESIVESVISKKQKIVEVSRPSKPSIQPSSKEEIPASKKQLKNKILEDLGGNDIWKGIYQDTASSANPILNNEEAEAPGEIPSSVLEQMGLVKDYSKYLGSNKHTVAEEDDEWRKRRELREKMLNENVIKRA